MKKSISSTYCIYILVTITFLICAELLFGGAQEGLEIGPEGEDTLLNSQTSIYTT